MEEYAASGRVLIETDGGCESGFLILGGGGGVSRVYQACIEYDQRLLGLGRRLVERAENLAREDGSTRMRLRCRESLSANFFWDAIGWEIIGKEDGGLKRGKKILVYEKRVSDSLQL